MRAISKILLLSLLIYVSSVSVAQTLTGHWESRGQNESGLWLDTEQSKSLVKFQLQVSRGAPSYNTGWIQGEVEIKNNVGHFKKETESGLCEIDFYFQPKRVELEHLGDYSGCDFGYNVFAIGVLERLNHKRPKFCAGDPRSGGCE